MGLTRRRFATAAVGGGLSLPSIGRARAAGAITVAALDGVFRQVFQTAVIDPFRRLRPDVAVYYYGVSSPSQIVGLLRQRQVPPQFDVVLLNPKAARAATAAELLAPMDPGTLPATADLVSGARLPGMVGVVAMMDCLALAHVPEATQRALTSWRTLWDPTVVRSLTVAAAPDPAGIGFTLIASALYGRGLDAQSIANGVNAISTIVPRIVSWQPRPDVYDFLIDGNAAFGVAWNGIGQVRARRNTERLRMAIPTDAQVRAAHTLHLVKGTVWPEAARAFAAYVLGPECQAAIADNLFMTPVNPRALVSATTMARLCPLADADLPLEGIDSPAIEAQHSLIVNLWRDRILRAR
jgi:putative spermidine/putrescine transport system substrate-binding protein